MLLLTIVDLGLVGYIWYVNATRLWPFSISMYEDLLGDLRVRGFRFVLARDYDNSFENVVVLVHDVDSSLHGLDALTATERKIGVTSSIYVRPDGGYDLGLFKPYENDGFEIGFHYDCLSEASGDLLRATSIFKTELSSLRTRFNVVTVRSHGAADRRNNLDVVKNQTWLMRELGFREVNLYEFDSIIQDTHHVWQQPTILGSRVLVLTHTDWW